MNCGEPGGGLRVPPRDRATSQVRSVTSPASFCTRRTPTCDRTGTQRGHCIRSLASLVSRIVASSIPSRHAVHREGRDVVRNAPLERRLQREETAGLRGVSHSWPARDVAHLPCGVTPPAHKTAVLSQIPHISGAVFARALRFARNAFERRRPVHCKKATSPFPYCSVPPPFRSTASRTFRFPESCGAPSERWRVLPNPVPSPHFFAGCTSVPEVGCRSAVGSPGAGKPPWASSSRAHQIAARSEVEEHQLR